VKATLNIPEGLLQDAQRLLKYRTKSEVVTEALKAAVRQKRLECLCSLKGKLVIDDVIEELEQAELKDAARSR
jgi:hypothetical protein